MNARHIQVKDAAPNTTDLAALVSEAEQRKPADYKPRVNPVIALTKKDKLTVHGPIGAPFAIYKNGRLWHTVESMIGGQSFSVSGRKDCEISLQKMPEKLPEATPPEL